MATQHQKRTAIRTGKIPTGQPMRLTPRERLENAGVHASSRDTNAARIKYEREVAYGGTIETSATYLIFNVDGEVYLRPDGYSRLPSAYGRHAPDAKVGHKDEEDANPDLRRKADRLVKELQKAVDEAGKGDAPSGHDVRLRELVEDHETFVRRGYMPTGGAYYYRKLNSPLGGLRSRAIKTAERLEEITKEIQEAIRAELEAERAKGP